MRLRWRYLAVTVALVICPGLFVLVAQAGGAFASEEGTTCEPFDHSHSAWDQLLKRFVKQGVVQYGRIKREGQPDLTQVLQPLETTCKSQYTNWTRKEKLAFWINAYNAYTVKLIVDHYPIKTIRSIGALPDAAFNKSFIPLKRLRGKMLSLNDIEHGILRKAFHEPRIHFAVVCASESCPALRSDAYRGKVIGRQLEAAARGFLRDTTKNRYDEKKHILYLSSIFKWFRKDFERGGKTLVAFVKPYFASKISQALDAHAEEPRIEFLDYDWSLNGK